MIAGKLRERVTIQRSSPTADTGWGPSTTWADVATVSASVIPADTSEPFTDKGVVTRAAFSISIRYRADVTSKDRITWRGQTLDIAGIDNVGSRNRELIIKAVAHG